MIAIIINVIILVNYLLLQYAVMLSLFVWAVSVIFDITIVLIKLKPHMLHQRSMY